MIKQKYSILENLLKFLFFIIVQNYIITILKSLLKSRPWMRDLLPETIYVIEQTQNRAAA